MSVKNIRNLTRQFNIPFKMMSNITNINKHTSASVVLQGEITHRVDEKI